jgi:hypothetical protein
VVIRNNVFGSRKIEDSFYSEMGSFSGVFIEMNSYGATVENNYFANLTSISGGFTIINQTSVLFFSIKNNTIRDIKGRGGRIIYNSANHGSISHTIAENKIHDIIAENNSGFGLTQLTAIDVFSGCNEYYIEKNLIYNLFAYGHESEPTEIMGMYIFGAYTIRNNIIQLGRGLTDDQLFTGIYNNHLTKIVHNTIQITGQGNASGDSYVTASLGYQADHFIKNNIFEMSRSNSGSGKNYAFGFQSTDQGINYDIDYNNYYFSGTNTLMGRNESNDYPTLEDWRNATGQDMNSIDEDPLFADPEATIPDLHLTEGSPCDTTGVLVASVIYDFDGEIRANLTPVDIGVDAGDYGLPCSPRPTAQPDGNNNLCIGATLNLTGTTDIGTSFLWSGPNGFTSNDQNPQITNLTKEAAGTYFFTATVDDCSSIPATFVLILSGLEVWSGDDSGSGTLRGAIQCAQNGDVITIDEDVSNIDLLSPILIDKNIEVQDNFRAPVLIYFDFDLTGFEMADYGLKTDAEVALKNLHLRHKNNNFDKPLLRNNSILEKDKLIFSGSTSPVIIHENGAQVIIINEKQILVD